METIYHGLVESAWKGSLWVGVVRQKPKTALSKSVLEAGAPGQEKPSKLYLDLLNSEARQQILVQVKPNTGKV